MIPIADKNAHTTQAETVGEDLPEGAIVIETGVLRSMTLFVQDGDGVMVPVLLPEGTEACVEVIEALVPPANLAPPLTEQQEAEVVRLSEHVRATKKEVLET